MVLSWNEIKSRAIAFSREWENKQSEDAEAKSFWDGFFHVFGINRRRVATFEQQVRKLDDKTGYIDLLWKGKIADGIPLRFMRQIHRRFIRQGDKGSQEKEGVGFSSPQNRLSLPDHICKLIALISTRLPVASSN